MNEFELKPHLKEGDAYVDRYADGDGEDVSVRVFHPRPIAQFFGSQPITARFRRTPLRWMKPDGKGGLVPR